MEGEVPELPMPERGATLGMSLNLLENDPYSDSPASNAGYA